MTPRLLHVFLGCDQRTQGLLEVSAFFNECLFGLSSGDFKLVNLDETHEGYFDIMKKTIEILTYDEIYILPLC
jgi:hypothetical protein